MNASTAQNRAGTGVASAALVAELARKVREHGTVVWLDADACYSGFVAGLPERWKDLGYSVVRFDGSYLELMLALKNACTGLEPDKLLVHLPGLNKDSVKHTPAFEIYRAGSVFEKALATLVREASVGHATPEDIDAFTRAPDLTLEAADRWLEAQDERPMDKVSRVLADMSLEAVVLDLIAGRDLASHLPTHADRVFEYLGRKLGITQEWRAFLVGDAELGPVAMGSVVASWLMAVEFVNDLKEAPATPAVAALAKIGSFEKDCRRLVAKLRDTYPDLYESAANELQDRLIDERTSHHAGALGSIDTFRFEEATVRTAVLGALRDARWQAAADLARPRTAETCFWVKRSATLRRTWEILGHAAKLGTDLAATTDALARCGSVDEAVLVYADKLAPVDRQHRVFEQRFHAQLGSDLEDYDALLEVRASARRAYRHWADALARAFFELCSRHGPLPTRALRQRGVYADEVHPRLEVGGRVAFVMVDALRFEMAQALAAELSRDKASQVRLAARLAELPTVTSVGMNALAPVEQAGRLRAVVIDGNVEGFSAGEFRVCQPADRVRAMSKRSSNAKAVVDLPLEEFHTMKLVDLERRLKGKSLVVVRSLDLDTAGESELHLSTFERTLAQLKSAIAMLGQAGIHQVVVAADHGFLLQDATVENVPFGATSRVPERRHAMVSGPSGMSDVLELRLSSLEYEVEDSAKDWHVVLRPDTAVWKTSRRVASFVHGGNSLQERVIPVLTIEREGARGRTMSRYEIVARAEPAHLGRQRLRISVRLQANATGSLAFLAPKEISLALRIPGDAVGTRITLLDAQPPASLRDGRILLRPGQGEAMVEFELEGPADDKVQIEVFHPEAQEDVTAKVVEGFFDVARDRRVEKAAPVSARPEAEVPVIAAPPPPSLIEDEAFRRVIEHVEQHRAINEVELGQLLGSPRRVRAFARAFDDLKRLIRFEVEVLTVNGMKVYARKD